MSKSSHGRFYKKPNKNEKMVGQVVLIFSTVITIFTEDRVRVGRRVERDKDLMRSIRRRNGKRGRSKICVKNR